ncbi:Fanconi anemia group D2 protein-like [Mizuhopecten yessoensis]|uniref:Fanconi anemia group D2 protein-like n=1 Tax=Mizuhopecten yessoensis TaxID=6573 RepID=UPI000B45E419|nr:Fanconi anemia group D2 protein-like [Mizuhopecten yessoensis]
MGGDRSRTSSKRKGSDHRDDRQKGALAKKRKSSDEEENYVSDSVFCQLLSKCGLTLKKGGKFNTLNVDQAVFQRNLHLALKRHDNYPEVVDEFVDGFQEFIEDQSRFHYSLLPTNTTSDCDSARSGGQDCAIRLMLGVDLLQPKLMNTLLEKLAEFMEDEDSIFDHGEKVNIPRLLMSQFRWLDSIINGKEVTNKMLEMIGIVSLDIQREIITCLPEVVEDSEHGEVAKALREILVQNNQLTVPILDALSNLTLSPELLSEVRGSVLQTLASVKMEDLPVVIKFLLQSVNNQDAPEVVEEIRSNLDFNSSFAPTISSTPFSTQAGKRGSKSEIESARGSELLTLDAIKSGIRFQKCVAEAWIKVIDGVKQPGDHKVIDIFILLILHSTNRKKPVESLFRNKIRAGGFTEVLVQAAFGAHSQVMRDYFPSILSLAEALLRSPEPAVVYFACAMYRGAFTAFDSFCQQEIVGNLVTHIGIGFEGEIDSSLDILAELVDTHLSKMAPFAIFVKGVLDYLDNLSVMQIRKLYSMLSMLAFRNPQEGGLIQDDLHILIRKQLSSNSPKYKRMGVIGAIMIIKSIAYKSTNTVLTQLESVPLSDDLYKQVVSLLQMVKTSSSRTPEVAALFMDELAAVIRRGQMDSKVETWISENVITDFQDDYVVDIEEIPDKSKYMIPFETKYSLDDDAEGSIAINIIPLVEFSTKDKKKQQPNKNENGRSPDPVCLSPHFRLLQICEEKQQGDLTNIDALLGCPLLLPTPEIFEKITSLSRREKEIVCTAVFAGLNWFRETVNAFAPHDDLEMKGKVITRVQNITELQGLLEKCLAATPNFKPPPANFDWYECPTPVLQTASGESKGKKKGRKAGKKKKGDKENSPDEESDENSKDSTVLDKTTADTQVDKGTEQSDKSVVNLSSYRPFFRELDISVFTILHTGTVIDQALDTDFNTKATTELSIRPKQLEFLLEDLTSKLSHILIASTSTRRSFFKTKPGKNIGFSHLDQYCPKRIAVKAVKLLPALCNHLEGASGFFQTMIAENDGLVDGPGSNGPEAGLMGSCFQLLLQALLSLFSWNGFLMTENKALLKEALGILVARIKTFTASQTGLQELVKTSHQYVANFANTVPNLTTAVTVLKVLITLGDKVNTDDLQVKIVAMSEEFLKREWLGTDGEKEKGAKHNENLQFVLRTYLGCSEDSLSSVETIATKGITELLETDNNGSSDLYPTLTKHSFPVFYRIMFYELIGCLKTISPVKQSDSREVKLDCLLRWNQAVRILHIMVNLIKAFDGRVLLGTALKCGRQFLDIFLRQGMPLLDNMFRSHRDDVQSLLKNLQLSTRALHHMCGHSKIMKNLALTNQVPFLKKSLEAFVYRVKVMLTVNKCLEAFWLGNLKNRDLKGEEIMSQASVVEERNEDESDEEETVPEDEEESDVEMDNQSEAGSDRTKENSDNESCSEIF